jgi:hypothetical protein
VNVTAFSATQKGTGFVADEISTNMHGGTPQLVVGEHIVWRVPVILSRPPTGDRGEVGAIDVDVETGQLMVTRELIEEIEDRAEHLVTRSASSQQTPCKPVALGGLWEGVTITDEDIAQVRREMWDNFAAHEL